MDMDEFNGGLNPQRKLFVLLGRTILNKKKSEKLLNRISNPLCVTINHYGDLHPEKWFYLINIDEEYKYNGFCSLMKTILYMLAYADYLHLTPLVKISKDTMYFDESLPGDNVFEYYFSNIGELSIDEIKRCDKVTVSKVDDAKVFGSFVSYTGDADQDMHELAQIYKKYFVLNSTTKNNFFKMLDEFVGEGNTLGVHVRATDYKQGYNKHPIMVTPEEYLEASKTAFNEKGFKKVFLATDEQSVIDIFRDFYGNNLVYYKDTFRSLDGNAIHYGKNSRFNRPSHKYLLGLEILRDVYTLGYCGGLIAGNSNVSYMARIISNAETNGYRYCRILDKGINHNLKRVRSHFNNMLKDDK